MLGSVWEHMVTVHIFPSYEFWQGINKGTNRQGNFCRNKGVRGNVGSLMCTGSYCSVQDQPNDSALTLDIYWIGKGFQPTLVSRPGCKKLKLKFITVEHCQALPCQAAARRLAPCLGGQEKTTAGIEQVTVTTDGVGWPQCDAWDIQRVRKATLGTPSRINNNTEGPCRILGGLVPN